LAAPLEIESAGMNGKAARAVTDRTLTTAPRARVSCGREGLGHAVGAEEVDRQMLFQRAAVAEVVVEPQARVVDQDVEGPGLPGGGLDLRRAGHVQAQRRDPLAWMSQRLAGAGAHTRRPSAEGPSASACPMPRLAPVTSTVVPSIDICTPGT
jgi:hypothetical protein